MKKLFRGLLLVACVVMTSVLDAAPVVVEATNADAVGACSWVSALLTGIKTLGLFVICR